MARIAVLVETDSEGTLTLLNHGHPSPHVLRADASVSFADLNAHAPPLGVAVLEVERPEPHEIVFGAGDQISLYTDGVAPLHDDAAMPLLRPCESKIDRC